PCQPAAVRSPVTAVRAVLAVSHEPFIVFASNAFAILGLRALYFLLADLHGRFRYLQTGLAVILSFVGVKMILSQAIHYHMPTYFSLPIIALILVVAVATSLLVPEEGDAGGTRHGTPADADTAPAEPVAEPADDR